MKKLIIAISAISIAILAIYANTEENTLDKIIYKCEEQSKTHKFSCYRAAIEKYKNTDIKSFIENQKDIDWTTFESKSSNKKDHSYAIFGTNCHTFYHALGDFIAENSTDNNLESMIKSTPANCTSGAIMGLYKRLALKNDFHEDLIKDFYNMCPQESKHQCSHEVGHILHDKYTYSILKPLDEITTKEFKANIDSYNTYKYTNQSIIDLNKPFEECKKMVPPEELSYCLTGIGHNLFLFSEFSPGGYKDILKDCNNISESNKKDCVSFLTYRIGINEVAPRFISGKIEEGISICDEVVSGTPYENLKYHCYLGLGGGIGLFIDSTFPDMESLEKNILKTKKEILSMSKLCERIPEEFTEKCIAGLLGTRFLKIYKLLNLKEENIERVLPKIDNNFEIVG